MPRPQGAAGTAEKAGAALADAAKSDIEQAGMAPAMRRAPVPRWRTRQKQRLPALRQKRLPRNWNRGGNRHGQ
jgi:hypothetical protein